MRVIVVIPCFEEIQTIANLVFESNKFVGFEGITIVADDNSSDGTSDEAKDAGAYVVRNFGKRGFGANTKAGIDVALIKDCDIVVTLDGDGQHNPSEMFRVLEPIEKGDADIVVGSRFLSGSGSLVPAYRKLGIKVITWLYNVGSKYKVTDAQCCFRAYRSEVLQKMKMIEGGFTFSTETLIKARALGFRIKEVPVTVLYHKQFSQNSTLNPIKQGFSVAFGTVKWRLRVELLDRIKHWFWGTDEVDKF